MIWYKCWLDTRWRFIIGLALMACSAAGVVLTRPALAKLLPMAGSIQLGGEIGRRVQEALALSRDYHGYVWMQWFGEHLPQIGTIFAVLLGTGGLVTQSSAVLFTLSMPVTRRRLLGVRAALGLGEWLVLVFAPTLLIPLLSPAIGERYGASDALIYGVCAFTVGAAFFSFAFLLSTIFDDIWRPLLIALLLAVVLAVLPLAIRTLQPYGVFRVMSAEAYFRAGQFPWQGLLISVAASAAMLYGAALKLERRDF